MTLRKDDPVRVVAHWSSFYGQRGVVVSVAPLMVRVHGDTHPMRFGDREVMLDEPSAISMTGAE